MLCPSTYPYRKATSGDYNCYDCTNGITHTGNIFIFYLK
jgi:hypothetical protein